MGILNDDAVLIKEAEKAGDKTLITVNCPDKTGLGCDLCRIILLFGLSIAKGDASTDGKWCYLVFWVVGKPTTRWYLLRERLREVCPPCTLPMAEIYYFRPEFQQPKPPKVFLLKFWCTFDRKGLLHDVTKVLCELELSVKRVKVFTAPDGTVMDLLFVTDTRELLHTKKRQEETKSQLNAMLGDNIISFEIELAGHEVTANPQGSAFLPPAITDDMDNALISKRVSVKFDNELSPSHTLMQILCQDHKGLIYDIMRTLKDYNIQVSYGRFSAKAKDYEVDLFIMQGDGKKIMDPEKQKVICSRLRMELVRPLRVEVMSRGPDTELLVANPVELAGKGRPLVFYDITLAITSLSIRIFSVEIARHRIHDREWEVYRVLLDEGDVALVPRSTIKECVVKNLMGWE
ncbi:ACT domain-containing protein ACR10 isoform X1 [Lactuca sativa]|uniref:ACT domain-containing protein ACR10 isoform X1 n=1 Tax=Lactuca sativa TaxID=4236 RepID=UPI000CD9E725|nr:ACT domain-containing protein ACR10 isoform X1 [Lactuca sativa]